MFIYNVKVNGSKLFKLFFTAIIVLVICILCFVTFRVFGGASKEVISSDMSCIPQNSISNISSNNYTNILKAVHDDIDSYVGVKIHFTGYVYRLADFTDTQFVLARNMIISSDFQTLVVGFLCHCDTSSQYTDGTWVNIVGEIKKGYYHGDIPIIDITEIKETTKPADSYVYPPDDYYIPTSSLICNSSC